MMKIFAVSLKMSNCIICQEVCPKPAYKRAWPKERKYCSSRCVKTAYRQNHPEADKTSKEKWLQNNPEKRAEASSEYYYRNKEFYFELAAKRVSRMKEATPPNLTEWDLFYLEEFYDLARKRGLEVDHIIPIQHPLFCGLHVPENLQLLSRSANAQKSNKFYIDNEDVVAIFKETK